MFDMVDGWLARARTTMSEYAALCHQIDLLEAERARLLADAVAAYTWPDDVPEPDRFDAYGVQHINGQAYGEDLTSELAVAHHSSEAAAEYLVRDVATLTQRLPQCWATVAAGGAPLWQARRIVDTCQGVNPSAWPAIDAGIAPGLGGLGPRRLMSLITATRKTADPEWARRVADQAGARWVRMGGDDFDPLTGWVSARLDRADALFLDATVQLVADKLAAEGDTGTTDERRARALGVLANPAAAIQLTGVHTTRGMNPAPESEAEKQELTESAQTLIPVFTPRTQVYVHVCADTLADPDTVARIEGIGPVLVSQVARLTHGTRIRATPVLHLGSDTISVDQYEIPAWMRDRLVLRNGHDVFPWSSIESRHLDLDHTIAYQPGQPGQTALANLGPLSRRAHRVKTHAGWQLDQPSPGVFDWHTGAGQTIRVDYTGSHPTEDRE